MLSYVHRPLRTIVTAALLAFAAALPAQAQVTLRAALHSDLKILDPIWTTALISSHHGYLVYDTLFALDESLQPQPQMVETYDVSPDKLVWTFTLRDGLAFHDGAPVTAEDCVQSLKRWAARDTVGQKLMSHAADLAVVDVRTFRLTLKEPYGLVVQSLAKSGSNVPFMMPKRIAATDPNTQITDATGSGPFIFLKDQWKPGEKAVYVKNPKYKPRSEPASGLAGGKVAKVDRIEWVWIPDSQTQVNALIGGEIDMIEIISPDLLPLLASNADIETRVVNRAGRQYAMRFNTLHKPFDNPKVRAAVFMALSQKGFLDANVGDAKWYRECKSLFPCGSPLESTKGWDDKLTGDAAQAKTALTAAGYDGTPIVLLHQTDTPGHNNLATVAKAQLERAGFKIDLQPMDWQTLVARRAKKEPPAQGGWHAYFTSWSSVDVLDPVSTSFLNAACDKATFGWPCDPGLEKLRDQYARETDPAKHKAIAEAVQLYVLNYPTHVPLGQFTTPTALRRTVTGLLTAPALAFWNIEKK
ncbi:ABC transporter substrate-binding protein [Reyranella sp. CPCC 100927]|uniref:ABC transporter substrate-binding protein n=1 Tax=Reyranella sp. CPCC 100927 TaxID=2599616 RepID=UPI0011B3B4FF|nr:ABC transporter substrate-binding protein [Reyranella sp. CPCC 100927]TWT08669.1 ABC transporter substrate-binding protein [Reyranella sp. CPCC 100927]